MASYSAIKIFDTYQAPEIKKPAPAAAPAAGEAKPAPAAAPAEGGGLKCDTDVCIYCGICAKQCPVSAITVDRAEKQWSVDKDACITCGVCVEKCPKKCLVIE